MPLRAIVRALGGEIYDGGRRANVPAPGHSARDRSVSLLWTGERLVAHGFGGADWRAVLDDLRVRGLIDASGRPNGVGAAAAPPLRSPELRVAAAAALWAGARPLEGTLAERHLRLRGVHRPLSASLRYHPAVPAAVYAAAGPERPALLAAITDPGGALTAVEMGFHAPPALCASGWSVNQSARRRNLVNIEAREGAGVGNHLRGGRLLRDRPPPSREARPPAPGLSLSHRARKGTVVGDDDRHKPRHNLSGAILRRRREPANRSCRPRLQAG
jgi:hypothetical protein